MAKLYCAVCEEDREWTEPTAEAQRLHSDLNHTTNPLDEPVAAFAGRRSRDKELIRDHLEETQLEVVVVIEVSARRADDTGPAARCSSSRLARTSGRRPADGRVDHRDALVHGQQEGGVTWPGRRGGVLSLILPSDAPHSARRTLRHPSSSL